MNTLPPELHSLIFEFACTDDGYTARSLSLVSHYTRDASKAFLYQCLSVAGLDQLLTITEKLEEAPHRLRRVRHLFLSDWTVSQTKMRLVPVNNEDMDRYEAEKGAIIHLLNLSASTLESLTIIISCPYNGAQIIGHLFSLSFPRLTDLSIHGFYPFPHSPNTFPRLERLHLSGNRNPHGLLQTGGLASSCPSLTQLKISGIVSASTFAEELDRTITSIRPVTERQSSNNHCVDNDTTSVQQNPTISPALRHILIEQGQEPSSERRYLWARRSHEKMLERLSQLERCLSDDSSPIKLSLSNRTSISSIGEFEVMRLGWLDGINGTPFT